jgi:hypothetical protein
MLRQSNRCVNMTISLPLDDVLYLKQKAISPSILVRKIIDEMRQQDG